jgi:hypothetical protein
MGCSRAGPGSASGAGCWTGFAAAGGAPAGMPRNRALWSTIVGPVARRRAAFRVASRATALGQENASLRSTAGWKSPGRPSSASASPQSRQLLSPYWPAVGPAGAPDRERQAQLDPRSCWSQGRCCQGRSDASRLIGPRWSSWFAGRAGRPRVQQNALVTGPVAPKTRSTAIAQLALRVATASPYPLAGNPRGGGHDHDGRVACRGRHRCLDGGSTASWAPGTGGNS